jgi:hypothetical protein
MISAYRRDGKMTSCQGDRTATPLSLLLVGGSKHNSGNNKSISDHEPKIGEAYWNDFSIQERWKDDQLR